jgi:hypothetical protein
MRGKVEEGPAAAAAVGAPASGEAEESLAGMAAVGSPAVGEAPRARGSGGSSFNTAPSPPAALVLLRPPGTAGGPCSRAMARRLSTCCDRRRAHCSSLSPPSFSLLEQAPPQSFCVSSAPPLKTPDVRPNATLEGVVQYPAAVVA